MQTFKILVIGGGRWAKVYIKEIISLSESISIELAVASQTNYKDLKKLLEVNNNANVYESLEDVISEDKIFDLSIIATTVEYHMEQCTKIIPYSKTLLVEKPLFTSSSEHEMFTKLVESEKRLQVNAIASCPYLFSNMTHKVKRTCQNSIKYIEGIWKEPSEHPLRYRYDKKVEMSAIPHLLPIIIHLVDTEFSNISVEKVEDKFIELNILQEDYAPKVKISFMRGGRGPSCKLINIITKEEKEIALDLNNEIVKKEGVRHLSSIKYSPNLMLTPLKSQILYCLSNADYKIGHLININNHKAISEMLDNIYNI